MLWPLTQAIPLPKPNKSKTTGSSPDGAWKVVCKRSHSGNYRGYCKNGEASRALGLFCRMVEEGIELSDSLRLVSLMLVGCSWKQTALLDICTRWGRMADAEKCSTAGHRTRITQLYGPGYIICGYARDGKPDEAISLFYIGEAEGTMTVDEVASAAVLGVCGMLRFRVIGEQIHCHSLKSGFMSNIGVGNATISSCCKCGNLKDGIKVFKIMPRHDVVSWNGLMAGHILHRQGDKTLAFWMQMVVAGLQPRPSASKKTLAFRSLGQAGQEICMMLREPEASVRRVLLDSCRVHLNTAVGKRAVKQILAMEPRNPSTYVLVSSLYSASGRWHCSNMNTSFVLHEVEEHQKTEFLFYQSVKLAVTYGQWASYDQAREARSSYEEHRSLWRLPYLLQATRNEFAMKETPLSLNGSSKELLWRT
ncbi:hypothetical protein RJ640_024124 [Escallonia rubra]|uniref:Pentatricopeptide repeat-containing protein n=1 Tax=Escallonia rubra TaxID=112253 RepID=A0AA88QCB2_9ASTE|nr:hypothetical protein RJ640_024124 [Escallonia rubra]